MIPGGVEWHSVWREQSMKREPLQEGANVIDPLIFPCRE